MTAQETYLQSQEKIRESNERFDKKVLAAQNSMWRTVLDIVRQLETDTLGNVRPTTKNLKLLRGLDKTLNRKLLSKGYKKGVNNFLQTFGQVKNIQDKYYGGIQPE